MHKNFKENVTRYWKSLDRISGYTVPNETIFRLLVNKKFNYKNKNILDIGIGNGDNLLEFKRRGADIFGVDIRGKIINSFCKINKLPKKNFFTLDLNYEFPIIQKKLDLINCKDIIYYIDLEKQFDFIRNCKNILKKNGYFLFQYVQMELKEQSKTIFNFNLNKNHIKLKMYHNKENPVPFLKNKHITKLIKFSGMKLDTSIFDINTHCKKNKNIIVNRYILLKK